MKAEEIVSGVEQMQFLYALNGELKNASELSIDEWGKISAVSVSVLFRSDCYENIFSTSKSFILADFEYVPTIKNIYQRQKYNFDISLRN
jgi:hypothetical protein